MATRVDRAWLRRTIVHSVVLVGLIFAAYLILIAAPAKGSLAADVVAYWRLNLADPYHGHVGDAAFFPYSPAVALPLAPFTALPWLAFAALWYCLLVGALVWLGGRSVLYLVAFPPVAVNLSDGNIHLLIAVAIVLGFRYPGAWAFVLLSKVTPGIGLLWFAVRREWRSLAVALGVTAVIVLATFAALPAQWVTWLTMLISDAGTRPPPPALPIPIWLRLPVAAAVVWWGARRDARWTVPIAAALAEPALWPGSFAVLAACWPLRKRGTDAAAGDRGYHAPDAHVVDTGGCAAGSEQPAAA
jgi:hypothetical protein